MEIPREEHPGSIRELSLGETGLKVGGARTMPFYTFDAPPANPPRVAFEVLDKAPDDWPAALTDALGAVSGDPVAWARYSVEEHAADCIALQLLETDPNRGDASPDDAASLVEAVAAAITVPLIVYGSGNIEKDAEVFKVVTEKCADRALTIGPAKEDNYRQIVASALAYGQKVIGDTPIDVNLAKQLNILIGNLGLDQSRILIDPNTGALGYGLEYTYSVIERDRLAALVQNDDKMQQPIICNLAKEAWKAREARVSEAEEASFGDAAERGILWEALTAYAFAIAGADILVMRHPKAVELFRNAVGRHLAGVGT